MSLHPLWGSILDHVGVDLLRMNARLELHWVTRLSSSSHIIEFESIADFHWFSDIPEPWNYAEITEVHSERSSPDRIKVDLMLWSEDAGISITAKRVLFDGEDAWRFLTDSKFAWSRYPEIDQ